MRCWIRTLLCLGILPLLGHGIAQADDPPRASLTAPTQDRTAASSGPTAASSGPTVVMNTTMGEIQIRLFPDRAPVSVANFLSYVDDGFYNGTIFHRVSEGYVIQGGGFTATFQKKETRAPIKNEAGNGLSNRRGSMAMARINLVDSATSQFFINVADNSFIDHKNETTRGYGFAVFGEVVSGMEVVDRIAAVKTGTRGPFPAECPLETVTILTVTRGN